MTKFFDFYSPKRNCNTEPYLGYSQFTDIFYPRYNYQLRKMLQSRTCLNNNIKSLDEVTKLLLRKLFIGEFMRIMNIIYSLNNIIYINNNEIFNKVSSDKKIITKNDIINFIDLYNKEINYKEEDINNIIISLSINRNYNNDNYNVLEGITEDAFNSIFNIKK